MTADNNKQVLIVIPAYNAAEHFCELVERIRVTLPGYDILIVNDGSTDDTVNILETLQVQHISFHQNRGKGAALLAGFNFALQNNYSAVLTLDADLQHAPEEIPSLLGQHSGDRIVIGSRNISREIMPLPRVISNSITSIIVSLFSGQRVRDSQSGFRLIPMAVINKMKLWSVDYDLESELLFKAGVCGIEIIEVKVSTIYDDNSKSHISPIPAVLKFIRQTWKRFWL